MGIRDWFKRDRGETFQLSEDDIVVFVVGPSGSGKTSFIKEVTKNEGIKVGATLQPSTRVPKAIRCELTEQAKVDLRATTQQHIVFVDTPSFNTDENESAKAERETSKWLSQSKSKATFVGVIYTHRVETDPTSERIQPHLDAFARTFPNGFVSLPRRIRTLFTYEGRIKDDKIQRHKKIFQSQLQELRGSLVGGGYLGWSTSFHPDLFQLGNPETAWRAVVDLFST